MIVCEDNVLTFFSRSPKILTFEVSSVSQFHNRNRLFTTKFQVPGAESCLTAVTALSSPEHKNS
jgi:hypothetical protein